ncbi:MAG TPA: UdgX family uracil-DNA binding protein [Burkholderiales bacterium]|nr:UdgX family uracil-DNA binding protein [Burkholderiales bacterium]
MSDLFMTEPPQSAADFIPENPTLPRLKEAAKECTGCPLYRNATQTVFGAGSKEAQVVLVGEQPGDREDLEGQPFVGPAGKLLDRALEEAEIARAETYVTNAVKHFKWELRGKRRLHKKPSERELEACLPWLEAELKALRPKLIVCLGVSAARSIFGAAVRIKDYRGSFSPSRWGVEAFVTVHPSSLLRLQGEQEREVEYKRFVADLKMVRERLKRRK